IIEGTITLTGVDVPLPDWCDGSPDCEQTVALNWSEAVDGIEAEGDQASTDAVLTISDTTVRLRPYVNDYHPLAITWAPALAIRPSCGAPCGADQTMCPVDGSCYSAEAFCTRCEQRTVAECACRTPEGPSPDGGLCQVYISNDQIVVGVCRVGVCETG
ncbi:hypothetical protein HQ535_09930, partial [bacterium]|nr:hypothetical protein [bacterium]